MRKGDLEVANEVPANQSLSAKHTENCRLEAHVSKLRNLYPVKVAQFLRICRWLQLIRKERLAPHENAPFSTQ